MSVYSVNYPGIDEARLDAIKAVIVAGLSSLNASLAVSPAIPAKSGAGSMTLAASQVLIGDPIMLRQSRISVVGGGENDQTDMEIQPFLNAYERRHEVTTSIFVYIHPDECPSSDEAVKAEGQERALARICDHLRARVFNTTSGINIGMASREQITTVSGGYYDLLLDCHITRIKKGITPKGMGEMKECLSAELTHTGRIVIRASG